MANITINIPELYDENIQKLKEMKVVKSRSDLVRTAIGEFLQEEYNTNLDLLGYFDTRDGDSSFQSTNLPKKISQK